MNPTYADFVAAIRQQGETVPSRHGSTVELLGTRITSKHGEMLDRENTNYNVGYCESLGLIAGVYDLHALHTLAPNAQHVLFTHAMAYGPRTTLQVPRVIEKLKVDPDSRQCVIYIGKPEDGVTNDQPCTTSMQVILRNNTLGGFVNMRSNDVIKGTPPDLMMFHTLIGCMAHCLHVKPGPVVLTCGSSHIYVRDIGRVIRPTTRYFSIAPNVPDDWAILRDWALKQLETPLDWPTAEGRSHRIPPLYLEHLFTYPVE